jgi:transcriptional regulator of acetoin/glycerol metabolism
MGQLRSRWEAFCESATIIDGVRPEIAASWRRSLAQRSVTPDTPAARMDLVGLRGFDTSHEAQRQFASAGRAMADRLAGELQGTNAVVIICDQSGLVLYRTGAKDILRQIDPLNLVPGGIWDERSAGTNGIGLALQLGQTAQVLSAEHYCGAFHDFSCTASPIRHPVTREVLGVLDLTDLSGGALYTAALVARAARELERLMEEQVFGRERELLERYLKARAGRRAPFLTVDRAGHTIIQNAQMLQTVSADDDVGLLLAVARAALRSSNDVSDEVELNVGRSLVEAQLVRVDGEVIGAVVGLQRPARVRDGPHPPRPTDWSPLVGRSPAMQELFRQAERVVERRVSIAIAGEPGTGKLSLARTLHRVAGLRDEPTIVNCARSYWREEWRAAVTRGGTVILQRLHVLAIGDQLELADELDMLAEVDTPPWVLAILSTVASPPERELLDRVARFTLTVPPLRDREHDVQLLISEWCRQHAGAGCVQPVVRQEAREALAARESPGNVRELFNTLDAAALRAGSIIGVDALGLHPAMTRAAPGSAAGSLQDVEREAIMQALARTGDNVTKAAKELGIGRATLHRRLRAYRLRGHTRLS